jgi:hypothetical protein
MCLLHTSYKIQETEELHTHANIPLAHPEMRMCPTQPEMRMWPTHPREWNPVVLQKVTTQLN